MDVHKMKFCTFASGSSGNSMLVSQGHTHILIDAGISMRRITLSLRSLNLAPCDLAAILITHEHSDHISGLFNFAKNYAVPVYAPLRAASHISNIAPHLDEKICRLDPGADFDIGDLCVFSFSTPHDTPDSVGYRVIGGGVSLAVVTDLGFVPDSVLSAVLGCDAAVLETNHDIGMLCSGAYPEYLKRRILGDRGHLSNEAGARLAHELVVSGTKRLVLAHLSHENNKPELAYSAVSEMLAASGAQIGRDYELTVAPRSESGCVYTV
jgi:phosphoribosyl 1,2-cyclic phosphodiesterase